MSSLELLSGEEAAEILRVSPSTLAKLRKEQKLPYVPLGKRVYYRRESLLNFINNCETTEESK